MSDVGMIDRNNQPFSVSVEGSEEITFLRRERSAAQEHIVTLQEVVSVKCKALSEAQDRIKDLEALVARKDMVIADTLQMVRELKIVMGV